MDAVREIHIVPVWREFDRILEPIRQYRPDRVYLLEHESATLEQGTYHDDLKTALSDVVPSVEVITLDLFDMYDVMGAVTTLADEHDGDRVRVNITAGTKRAAIGASMACMDASTTAEPYVVEPEGRDVGIDTPLTSGYEEANLMTMYPIQSPSRDQVAALAIVDAFNTDSRLTKLKTIIDEGRALGLSCFDPDEESSKSDYRTLQTQITDDLTEWGYLDIDELSSRSKHVTLTDSGLQALRSFRHRAEDVISELEASPGATLTLDNPVEQRTSLSVRGDDD